MDRVPVRRDGNYEIYVMNADGSDRRSLARDVAAWSVPAWSPDGRTDRVRGGA